MKLEIGKLYKTLKSDYWIDSSLDYDVVLEKNEVLLFVEKREVVFKFLGPRSHIYWCSRFHLTHSYPLLEEVTAAL